jgi:hypothetical protein
VNAPDFVPFFRTPEAEAEQTPEEAMKLVREKLAHFRRPQTLKALT